MGIYRLIHKVMYVVFNKNLTHETIDFNNLPQHVALIMDGNGRWAKRRGMPRLFGHQRGVETLKNIINYALEIGIPTLSAWAFSTANWKRPETEVSGLMTLLKKTLTKDLHSFHEKGIRLEVIGLREGVAADVLEKIDEAVELTRHNTKLNLAILFNYDGRSDILNAAKTLATKVKQGHLDPEQLTEELFSQHMLTSHLPDPDLLIRTSGLVRLSNFMMWQCIFTELVFFEKYWPDFTADDFKAALVQFQNCERKFGQIAA